jgi:hypothetical protein
LPITSATLARQIDRTLIRKQREANGLKEENIEFSDKSLLGIIRNYTRGISLRQAESMKMQGQLGTAHGCTTTYSRKDDGSNLLLVLKQKVADRGGGGNRA